MQYFFGYINWHGQIQSIGWMVDKGTSVGGEVQSVQKHEISEREFEDMTLSELENKYPFVEATDPSQSG